MANIRVLTWNIQIYGPLKYGTTPNNVGIAQLVARVIVDSGADIAVIQEVRSSVALGVAFSLAQAVDNYSPGGQTWSYFTTNARPTGDAESYVFIFRTDAGANFAEVAGAEGIAANNFPNNFSVTHGRRAAFKVFQTTDTNNYFAVTNYHAPPNNQAVIGVESCALMTEIYSVNPGGGGAQAIDDRLLCGDWNLDAFDDADYFDPLTDPVPANPPPVLANGEGAGTTEALNGNALNESTHVMTIGDAINNWGQFPGNWPAGAQQYRQIDMAIDNIFYKSNGLNARGVRDVISSIKNSSDGGHVRAIANTFSLGYPNGSPAFPNAQYFQSAINIALSTTAWAFLFYRYSISDHLPVYVDVTI
ncbi:MAG: hypothetical protein AAF416_03880 [Pseudomonadota bacterium]